MRMPRRAPAVHEGAITIQAAVVVLYVIGIAIVGILDWWLGG